MPDIRVLQSFGAPRSTTNPYIVMLDRVLSETPGVGHCRFSWREALTGRYDVFHLHWPETLLGGSTWWKSLAKQLSFLLVLERSRLRRVAIVRTVHNVELPRDVTRLQRFLLRRLESVTDFRIVINAATHLAADQPHTLILHGHYRDWFASMPRVAPQPARLGFVGLIRRYKGVENLIVAFRGRKTRGDDMSLHVSGKPSNDELAADLAHLAAGDERIQLTFGYLPDRELVLAITEAQLIVLPYRFMHNSGSVLAALSLERPVLVPNNEANSLLAAEVGNGWIHTFDGELHAEDLCAALERHRKTPPTAPPDLTSRDWAPVGKQHRKAYLSAIAISRERAV